ncbi:hypothetical protein RHSIM_RhsimUnG0143900 [Rhododendron simsii]|uniref:Tetraspanin/Peripherin n=1 Tax=Rhododendron simsii TaxID=118357 RepID=A0A834FXW5_RHOSS|nr:hypothetical protein RHSIM_RhsimUnG0143900 [Rhododendron simsii]
MAREISPATTRRVLFTLVAVASTIPVFFSGYYLAKTIILFIRGNSDGTHPHLETELGFTIFAFVLFLLGSIAIVSRVKPLQVICITTLVITVVLILAGTVAIESSGAYYQLEEYPRWAKNFILNDIDWGGFQRYMIREKICEKPGGKNELFLQGGCCSPPTYCGYREMNKTWIVPKSGEYYQDNNCMMWSNDDDKLCYNCNTCKAAYLINYVHGWNTILFYMFIALVIWIGCFNFSFGANNENNQGRQQTV